MYDKLAKNDEMGQTPRLGSHGWARWDEVGMRRDEGRRADQQQRAAHDALFRTHYPAVVSYLAARVPLEDAKDLAADVFVEAWRQRDQVIIDPDRGWLPWLFTVARRVAATWRTSRTNAQAREIRIGVEPAEDFVERIVAVQTANADLAAVLTAMPTLPPEDREILELCGLFGFTPNQAAITLGIPSGTVRVRLHRARRRLAEAVDGGDDS